LIDLKKCFHIYSKIGFVRVGEITNFALSSNGNYNGTTIYYKRLV
ncbi:hypothetical protein ACFMJK_17125, partial [Acinetobacter baumannii]